MKPFTFAVSVRSALFLLTFGLIAIMSYWNTPWSASAAHQGQTITIPSATPTATTTATATATTTGTQPTATATTTGTQPTATATATGTQPTATATATGTQPTATATATGTQPTATSTATSTMTPMPVNVIIGSAGGSINAVFQGLTINLNFPPGLFTQPVTVSVGMTTTNRPGAGTVLIGNGAFFIEVHLQSNGQPLTTFASFFTLMVSYTNGQTSGLYQQSLYLSYWDETTGSWITIPTMSNPSTNQLSASLNHLTAFAAFGLPEVYLLLPIIHR